LPQAAVRQAAELTLDRERGTGHSGRLVGKLGSTDQDHEPHHTPPVPLGRFALRMLVHAGLALALIGISLFVGIIGYEHYEHMSWLDAFLNSEVGRQ
jgi:hypothetical protein